MNRLVASGIVAVLRAGTVGPSFAEDAGPALDAGDLRPSVGAAAPGPVVPDLPFDAVAAEGTEDGTLPVTCLLPPAKFEQSVVDAFLAAPDGLLARHPMAGLPMVIEVRGLSGSDARAVIALIDLSRRAESAQKAAIGAGMARAAVACATLAADYSAFIQEMIVKADDVDLLTAFAAAAGDFETTAIARVPGGVPGYAPISGVAAPGGSTNGIDGDTGVVQTVGTYTFQRRRGIFGPIDDGEDVSGVSSGLGGD